MRHLVALLILLLNVQLQYVEDSDTEFSQVLSIFILKKYVFVLYIVLISFLQGAAILVCSLPIKIEI